MNVHNSSDTLENRNLDNIRLLAGLEPTARQVIASQCVFQKFSPETFLLDRDQQSDDVLFIIKGKARIVNYAPNGKEISFADIGAGECLGEIAAIDGRPRSAAVMALTQVQAGVLKATQFRKMLLTHPIVALALLEKVAGMLRAASERVMYLSTSSAYARVYAEVLRQAELELLKNPLKSTGNVATLSPAPVQSDIAARVSTTRETVARAFGIMQKRNLLRRIKGGIEILDIRGLTDLLEESRLES
ncbi:MAG: Crp/Fnr family transcriptional regulator [Holosporales bacterium]|jgi:CRP/FNR family cyclic AMP-dependent transcriptional regulator